MFLYFFLSNVFAETKLSRNEEINLLNKIGYGVTSEDLNHLEKIGQVSESGFLARLTETINVKTISFTENISEIIKSNKIEITNITEHHIDGYYNYAGNYKSDLSSILSGVESNFDLLKKIQNTNFNKENKFSKIAQFVSNNC